MTQHPTNELCEWVDKELKKIDIQECEIGERVGTTQQHEKEPCEKAIDLGENSTCNACGERYCKCHERKKDGWGEPRNTQESWEEKFEKIGDGRVRFIATREEVRNLIRSTLAKQVEEISEAVEKKMICISEEPKDYDIANQHKGYNQALKDVLNLLAIKQVINK